MHFIKNTAKSFLFFLIIIGITSLIYTSIIYFNNTSLSNEKLNIISFFITITLFLILGIYISFLFQEKGLMNSLLISLILIFIILLFKFLTKTFDSKYLIKALCCIISSSIGGILGINFKKK